MGILTTRYTSTGREVPPVVIYAVQTVANGLDRLDALCRAYGTDRGAAEAACLMAQGQWLERQLSARRTLAKAQAIAQANGWNWSEIEAACLD